MAKTQVKIFSQESSKNDFAGLEAQVNEYLNKYPNAAVTIEWLQSGAGAGALLAAATFTSLTAIVTMRYPSG